MNKVMKKLLCACLALAMLITIIPPVTAQAAKTKSVVLQYKGEVVEVSDNFYSTVKSVSSSKKAVVAAKKDSKRNYKAILTAKKAGKSTVTLKTKNGTFKYAVTVKNYDFTVSFKNIGNDYLLMSVKNNTKTTFDDLQLTYTLCNSAGDVIEKKEKNVSDLLPGKKSYEKISVYGMDVDPSQCTAKAKASSRSLDAKYTNLNSKIKFTTSEEKSGDDTEISVKMKNNSKKSARGTVFVFVYDANGNILDVKEIYVGSFDAGNIKTESVKVYNFIGEYDHYKIVPALYSKKQKVHMIVEQISSTIFCKKSDKY